MTTKKRIRRQKIVTTTLTSGLTAFLITLIFNFQTLFVLVVGLFSPEVATSSIEIVHSIEANICDSTGPCVKPQSIKSIEDTQRVIKQLNRAKDILSQEGQGIYLSCGDIFDFSGETAATYTLSVKGDEATLTAINQEVCDSAFLARGSSEDSPFSIIQIATYNLIDEAESVADALNQSGFDAEIGLYAFRVIPKSTNNNSIKQPSDGYERCWTVSIPETGSNWCSSGDHIF